MFSVDFAKNFYRDETKLTGFMAEEAKQLLNVKNHKFYLGAGVTSFLEEIGKDIEFVILDTMHILPGEILDFLVVLPYLKSNAVVCLHDVALCQRSPGDRNSTATGLLFSSVTADKMINLLPDDVNLKFAYPNIGAFQINDDTFKNVINVVMSLLIPWHYLPPVNELKNYNLFVNKFYDKDICKIYDEMIKMNVYNMVMPTFK